VLLSSVLRQRNRPQGALERTELFEHTRNTAVLTTRAATLADLGRMRIVRLTAFENLERWAAASATPNLHLATGVRVGP
jgi:hypothetical protein